MSVLMTPYMIQQGEQNAATIAFFRRNPCMASELLLGIKLTDIQKWIVQSTWNSSHAVWACCRDFGKSFLGAVIMWLKALLYENQAIYIVSSVGDQSKETFTKIEEIVTRMGKTSASIASLTDISEKETVKSSNSASGFAHNPSGFSVKLYNGSGIYTLNSAPDNARSRRATMVFFDEAAFCSDELIAAVEPFAAQNSNFVTSTDRGYDIQRRPVQPPTQLIYASSQDTMDKMFYHHYKDFAKKMLAGDRDYFVCDLMCDTAIRTYMEGKLYIPLLNRSKVETALAANKEKALREYYNLPTNDSGEGQIVKWGTIRRNEKYSLPTMAYNKDCGKFVLAFDPARTIDNAIVSVMELFQDANKGLCGRIVNCVNMLDVASRKRFKLDSNRQLAELRQMLLNYNGSFGDYQNIDALLIDQGSGGGGTSTYADGLLNNWQDESGKMHSGLIDAHHEIYEGYTERYPDAIDKLRLINPRKYRTQMVEEFIELINLGCIQFPYEYKGHDIIKVTPEGKSGDNKIEEIPLSVEEQTALENIDMMKTEITSIQKTSNAEKTSVMYALSKDKQNRMHDDRFYTMILLAHRLYELRREAAIKQGGVDDDWANAPSCVGIITL